MTIHISNSAGPVDNRVSATGATTYLAGPLDQINAWIAQWGTALQVLGATILGICVILVGIKLGAKSVASSGSSSTGTRESLGAIFQLAIAGILIGAALIVVPMLIGVGSNSGTTSAPPPAAAAGV